MILPVEVYGSTVLRKKSEDIEKDYPRLDELICDMFETMYHADGIGLAAPQIGLNIRLIVTDLSAMDQDDEELKGFRKVFINPHIISVQGDVCLFNEGCLSVPGLREDVERHEKIKISYYDEQFTPHTEEFSGIQARVLQHEHDHLEGNLFVDHLSPLKRKLINRKLQSISKGKVNVDYKTKIPK